MTDKPISYYDILEVTPHASDEDIRNAYYKLAKRFHPDTSPLNKKLASLRLKAINEAYAGINTKEKRIHYNRTALTNRPDAYNDNQKGHGWFFHLAKAIGIDNRQEQ